MYCRSVTAPLRNDYLPDITLRERPGYRLHPDISYRCSPADA